MGTGRRLAGIVLAVALAATTASATGQPGDPLTIPDGTWQGFVSFDGAALTTETSFQGSFVLTVAGGIIDDGLSAFGWSGVTATRAGTTITTDISGIVGGPAEEPEFTITQVLSNGSAIPDASGGGTVELTHTSCARVEGTAGVLATSAEITNVTWFAVRADTALDPAVVDEMSEIFGLADILLADVAAGSFDPDQFLELVNRSATLSESLPATTGCSAGFYRSLIAGDIERLIGLFLENPDLFGPTEFVDLVWLAVQTGVIGAGASSPGAASLEAALIARLYEVSEPAIATLQPEYLFPMAAVADLLGETELLERILTAIAELP